MTEFLTIVLPLALGSLVTLIAARAYYRKGGLSYFVKDFELIDLERMSLGDKVLITAAGEPVSELRVAKFAVWNSGTVCYLQSHISGGDPFRVCFPTDGFKQVLEYNQSRRAVGITFENHQEHLRMCFDILDEGDWVVFRALYQGAGSKEKLRAKPDIRGALANLPTGLKAVDLEDYFTEKHWARRIAALAIFALPIALVTTTYFVYQLSKEVEKIDPSVGAKNEIFLTVVSVFIVITVLASVSYQILRWRLLSTRVPRAVLEALK